MPLPTLFFNPVQTFSSFFFQINFKEYLQEGFYLSLSRKINSLFLVWMKGTYVLSSPCFWTGSPDSSSYTHTYTLWYMCHHCKEVLGQTFISSLRSVSLPRCSSTAPWGLGLPIVRFFLSLSFFEIAAGTEAWVLWLELGAWNQNRGQSQMPNQRSKPEAASGIRHRSRDQEQKRVWDEEGRNKQGGRNQGSIK